jgi:hypothetical protein
MAGKAFHRINFFAAFDTGGQIVGLHEKETKEYEGNRF